VAEIESIVEPDGATDEIAGPPRCGKEKKTFEVQVIESQ
jgi:hypothetical protein